jgi:microcystin-dependent protein
MAEPFIGEIREVSINFAPKGWLFCAGQTLAINQNQALFSLLGTTFGGNGVTTFNLPDLRSRIPVGANPAASLPQGSIGGQETVTLLTTQLPAHQHTVSASLKASNDAEETNPQNLLPAVGALTQYGNAPANTTMGGTISGNTANAGGNQPHDNRQPLLGINYIIALQGIFPSRN